MQRHNLKRGLGLGGIIILIAMIALIAWGINYVINQDTSVDTTAINITPEPTTSPADISALNGSDNAASDSIIPTSTTTSTSTTSHTTATSSAKTTAATSSTSATKQ